MIVDNNGNTKAPKKKRKKGKSRNTGKNVIMKSRKWWCWREKYSFVLLRVLEIH